MEMYFNGAINQYGNGIGVLLITLDGSHISMVAKLNFEATNNIVELWVQAPMTTFFVSFLGFPLKKVVGSMPWSRVDHDRGYKWNFHLD